MEHFDDFYADIYKKEWNSIRHALTLKKQKYMALINNYSDSDETMRKLESIGSINVRRLFDLEQERVIEDLSGSKKLKLLRKANKTINHTKNLNSDNEKDTLVNMDYSLESSLKQAEIDMSRLIDTDDPTAYNSSLFEFLPATKIKGMEDYITESSHYGYYDVSELNVPIEREYELNFPNKLNIYSYEQDNDTPFDPPRPGSTGALNYFLLDGGSILPVLALNVKRGNTILDMCAAPGGKSLIALQTLMPDLSLVCNDVSKERVDRIFKVFKSYLYDFNERWLNNGKIKITKRDGRYIQEEMFDRIIVI